VDGAGNAYVTGTTTSTNFPTANPMQAYGGGGDAFVTKINAAGTGYVYSTYLGGNSQEQCFGIAVDGSGNAYVTGGTVSSNFPTVNPVQATLGSVGNQDVFVTKINAVGSAIVYSTYLGGSLGDYGSGIALDGSGNAHVTGTTASTNFPTFQPFQANFGGYIGDAFVASIAGTDSATAVFRADPERRLSPLTDPESPWPSRT
jgi:Beta-propeller repeat